MDTLSLTKLCLNINGAEILGDEADVNALRFPCPHPTNLLLRGWGRVNMLHVLSQRPFGELLGQVLGLPHALSRHTLQLHVRDFQLTVLLVHFFTGIVVIVKRDGK